MFHIAYSFVSAGIYLQAAHGFMGVTEVLMCDELYDLIGNYLTNDDRSRIYLSAYARVLWLHRRQDRWYTLVCYHAFLEEQFLQARQQDEQLLQGLLQDDESVWDIEAYLEAEDDYWGC